MSASSPYCLVTVAVTIHQGQGKLFGKMHVMHVCACQREPTRQDWDHLAARNFTTEGQRQALTAVSGGISLCLRQWLRDGGWASD